MKDMQSETKACQNCKGDFTIAPEDFEFYTKIKVPPPTWCPYCRLMRRLIWRNERTLYKRDCSLCSKSIIAMYPQEAVFPVYCRECWFSDAWDATSYGREYDFSKNFFVQFMELLNTVPQIALQVNNSRNSDFINQAASCNNCYLITGASDNEDCFHSNRLLECKNIGECLAVHNIENSYEARECRESSSLKYCDDCHGSFNLTFCYDARSSNDCFMSSNLRSKSYVWYGEQLSKEDYKEKMKSIDLGLRETLDKLIGEYEELKKKSITRFSKQKNITNSTGNVMTNTINCRNSFYVSEIENGNNLLFVDNATETHDTNNGCCTMEYIYEVNTGGLNCYNNRFCSDTWPEVRDTTYSMSCRDGVKDLFGCVSLRKKSYYIFNKEYSKDEYLVLVEKIIKHMDDMPYTDQGGRIYGFGEFFPPELSPFAFNESAAYTYTPLSKKEVLEMNWQWKESEEKNYVATIRSQDLPHVNEVTADVVNEVIACAHAGECEQQCTTAFRIIPAELEFYKIHGLALPLLCPNCRHYERVKNMSSLQLYSRECMCKKENHEHAGVCQNQFETSYSPDRPEIVYCEDCYNKEVN